MEAKKDVELAERDGRRELDLSTRGLANIPRQFCPGSSFIRLTKLDLHQNAIKEIPESFHLPKLRMLLLWDNQLESLPESIGNLTTLEVLDMDKNMLTSLPDTIGNLTRMERIYVSHNKLVKIPATLSNLKNLNGLAMNNNSISRLPRSLMNLVNLEGVGVDDNPLTYPPLEIAQRGAKSIIQYLEKHEDDQN